MPLDPSEGRAGESMEVVAEVFGKVLDPSEGRAGKRIEEVAEVLGQGLGSG